MTTPNDNVYKQPQADAATEQQVVESNMDGEDKASTHDSPPDNVHEDAVQQDNAYAVPADSEKNDEKACNNTRRYFIGYKTSSQPKRDELKEFENFEMTVHIPRYSPSGIIRQETVVFDNLDHVEYDCVEIPPEFLRNSGAAE